MFNPDPELHDRFEAALQNVKRGFGRQYSHFINGEDNSGGAWVDDVSPIDTDLCLGKFPVASAAQIDDAVSAARAAYPSWRATPASERMQVLRRAGALIEERVFEISAAVAYEVGKNRMEALGEVQETADFFYGYCDDFAANENFDHVLPDDPLPDYASHNRSVMKPYGVWAIISPFNFPFALSGGPVAAALVTGNTVVVKASPDTPWAVRLLAECLRDAGLPAGVMNYLADPDDLAGPLLLSHAEVAGATFTGSHEVGMQIYRQFAASTFPRPCIAEMGGKNACIVTENADLDRAAIGIMRSAFGLSGQKCSALSRLYVESSALDGLLAKLVPMVKDIRVGDPTHRESYIGPVANLEGFENYKRYIKQLRNHGANVIIGGHTLEDGELKNGYYCAPTVVDAALDNPLWQEEMFVPILMLAAFSDISEAMRLANGTSLGLTAGFYGNQQETEWFFDNIEAGVTYANRPQGATTGAWPGYQPFGGWKGSGTTGKGIASYYYLAQYLREQSQTIVE